MFKYLSLLVVYAIAFALLLVVLAVLAIVAIFRGLLWDFKFRVDHDFHLRDLTINFVGDLWNDLHDYWYKPKKTGGC